MKLMISLYLLFFLAMPSLSEISHSVILLDLLRTTRFLYFRAQRYGKDRDKPMYLLAPSTWFSLSHRVRAR